MQNIIRLHALLAVFFLPVALLFFVTGAFYTYGITGNYETRTLEVALEAPLAPDLNVLEALADEVLAQEGIAPPTGAPRIRKAGTSYMFEWTGSNRDLVIHPTDDLALARVEIKETTWYRKLVQLHKAKGGNVFKAYAIAMAIALMALLLSGSLIAWRSPKLRRQAAGAAALGLLAFALFVWMG